ncbi:hypothetical protein [Sporosarcina sp. FA9]|uniref:hypothetical protein n=1 Tax=Sporosarcina sp. FA9 TaxID=3413030 RepID=UPI003F65D5F8
MRKVTLTFIASFYYIFFAMILIYGAIDHKSPQFKVSLLILVITALLHSLIRKKMGKLSSLF